MNLDQTHPNEQRRRKFVARRLAGESEAVHDVAAALSQAMETLETVTALIRAVPYEQPHGQRSAAWNSLSSAAEMYRLKLRRLYLDHGLYYLKEDPRVDADR